MVLMLRKRLQPWNLLAVLTNYFNSMLYNLYLVATVSPSAMDCQDKDQNEKSGCCDKTSASSAPSNICEITEQPLQSLKLASHAVLKEAQQRGRLKCSKCGGSRKFFCYTCCSLVGVTQEEIPIIKVGMKSLIIVKIQLCWRRVNFSERKFQLLSFVLGSASCKNRHHQAPQ